MYSPCITILFHCPFCNKFWSLFNRQKSNITWYTEPLVPSSTIPFRTQLSPVRQCLRTGSEIIIPYSILDLTLSKNNVLRKASLVAALPFYFRVNLNPDLLGRKDSILEYVIPDPQHCNFRVRELCSVPSEFQLVRTFLDQRIRIFHVWRVWKFFVGG